MCSTIYLPLLSLLLDPESVFFFLTSFGFFFSLSDAAEGDFVRALTADKIFIYNMKIIKEMIFAIFTNTHILLETFRSHEIPQTNERYNTNKLKLWFRPIHKIQRSSKTTNVARLKNFNFTKQLNFTYNGETVNRGYNC